MADSGARADPFGAFNFIVEIDGLGTGPVAAFQEVSLLGSESTIVEYRAGNADMTRTSLPGLAKYRNLILERGVTTDQSLWEWWTSVVDGNIQRRNGSVTQLDESREPVVRFDFLEGLPVRCEGPTLDSARQGIAIETLEIAHAGVVLAST